MSDADSNNYKLSSLVLDMNYSNIWSIINDLKAEKISNSNCNINSEKFRMLPELFERINKSQAGNEEYNIHQTKSSSNQINKIYINKLNYSEHVKHVKIERVSDSEDENLEIVTFKNVRFFKIEDHSRKSYFEYDLPLLTIDKTKLRSEVEAEVSLDIKLLEILENKIVPKFDALYNILNFGTYNPSFKHYFGEIINGCKKYFASQSEIKKYDYTKLSSKYQNCYHSTDMNDYYVMSITQPYSSTRIRLLSQFQDGYTFPFTTPDDCLLFLTKFLLEDLQISMESYADPTARTFVANKFYESLESRLSGLVISGQDAEEEARNLKKYLNFLKNCNKFKRHTKSFFNNEDNIYDPIMDLTYCLWGEISNIVPAFFRLSSICKNAENQVESLLDYFAYNLSCRNDEIEDVSGAKRTLLIALKHYPSFDLNIDCYQDYRENLEPFFINSFCRFDLSSVPSFSSCSQIIKKSSFTQKFKKTPKETSDDFMCFSSSYSEKVWEKHRDFFKYDLRFALNSFYEGEFEAIDETHIDLESTNQLLAKRTFSTIAFCDNESAFNSNSESTFGSDFWHYFNKDKHELEDIEDLLTQSPRKSESKLIIGPSTNQDIFQSMQTLLKKIQDEIEKETKFLQDFLKRQNVLFAPIQEPGKANIFKENRIFLEHADVRTFFYELVGIEFFNTEGNFLDPLKNKIIQVILSFADPFGRPVGQNDKIMSIDYLSDLIIGLVSDLLSGNVSLNEKEKEQKKMKIAALFTGFIKASLHQLNMDKMNYDWLNIDEGTTWIEKTNDMFNFNYTTRSLELAYNANILMTFCIWKLTKDLSACSFTPAAELFAWAWSSCNLNLQVYLKIDQIEESYGLNSSFPIVHSHPWSPYLLKTLTLLSSGWRYVLATILNQKCDEISNRHEFEHLSFNQFMSPSNRQFSSGALSSTSIELLENCLNIMIKRHFVDFNKNDELVLQKKFANMVIEELANNDLNAIQIEDFFQNQDKKHSYFEKIEIIPDDDLDDDVQYVFKDLLLEEDYYFPLKKNSVTDPNDSNKKYFFDYRDPQIYFSDEENNDYEDDDCNEEDIDNDEFFVSNTISAIEEFLYRTEIVRCSCSVTKAFIKKQKHLDLNKHLDPTQNSLIFVDSSAEFCPSELLSLFAPFITYAYLSDNNYDFDSFFPFKPITDINFRSFIERFLSLHNLAIQDKMQMVSEIASINFHFNEVFERGVVFTEDEILDNPSVKNSVDINIDSTGREFDSEETSHNPVTNEMKKFNTRKGFFEDDIDEVKACFNLRGELLQMLLKMDSTLFNYMEKDYYFVERVLDELLMDKFYMCWINCLFTLMKVDTEEEFYNDRYFCLYIFKLISRSIGPMKEESMFDDCFLIKDQRKFDYLRKSYTDSTVLPDMDHAFFYFSFLAERTSNFLNNVGVSVLPKTMELIRFYTEFFVNQFQGLYLCLISVSQCGFDLPKNKEFFNVSCLNSKFLLHLSEQGCIGAFPYNKKDLNAVNDFFKTFEYVTHCIKWLVANDGEESEKFKKMGHSLIFLKMEFSSFFETDKNEFKIDISNKFTDMVLETQFDFNKHQLGTFMYVQAKQNQIINDSVWQRSDYYPIEVLKLYSMFYETSKHFSNMNMNSLISNSMAFKHSVDHGLDLTEKSGDSNSVEIYSEDQSISKGFIYKEKVLRI